MGKNKIFILGMGVSSLNFKEVLEEIRKYLENGKWTMENERKKEVQPLVIFTPNPEIIVYGHKDNIFKQIVNSAQINIPDGQGIIWASRFLGQPLKERVAGIDLLEKLVELAAKKGLTVGLIGGGPQIAVKALECLKEKYPGLLGWAEEGPKIKIADSRRQMANGYDLNNLVEKIRKTNTKILFVGLGAPKQEYFINILNTEYLIHNTPLVLMSVGGAFDYLSGRVKRAPKWMQNLGFEWLYRLFCQPWRIKRQLALLKFIFLVVREKLLNQKLKQNI